MPPDPGTSARPWTETVRGQTGTPNHPAVTSWFRRSLALRFCPMNQDMHMKSVSSVSQVAVLTAVLTGLMFGTGCVYEERRPRYYYAPVPPPPPPVVVQPSTPPPPSVSTNQPPTPAAGVEQAPPAPVVEVIPTAPSVEYVWAPGYWAWNGRWVWTGGRWVLPPRRGAIWIPGHWERRRWGRHYWVPGHWR